MVNKKQKDHIKIPRKAIPFIIGIIPLTAIIISKGDFGALIVLILGLACGILIRHNWK